METLSGKLLSCRPQARREDPILSRRSDRTARMKCMPGQTADRYLLVADGQTLLDLNMRSESMHWNNTYREDEAYGIIAVTPGVRSVHINYASRRGSRGFAGGDGIESGAFPTSRDLKVQGARVSSPLSGSETPLKLPFANTRKGVRHDAPWCPRNRIHRRCQGLDSIDEGSPHASAPVPGARAGATCIWERR